MHRGPLPDGSSENFVKRSLRSFVKKAIQLTPPLIAVPIALAGCGEKNSNQQASDSGLEKTVLEEQYKLPYEGTWFLTGGPHDFRLPIGAPIDGVLASDLDFAPKPVVPCPPGKEIVLKDWNIAASKSGIVTIVGDQKNQKDPNHSIVQIKHADGQSTRYVHSADIEVKKGDTVRQNQVIAHPSCEVPPSGYTIGLHLDFSVLDANGNPIDIRGLTFDGWKVDSSSKNYQGTLSKNGEKLRTAEGGRCDTDAACGGIRNDLSNNLNGAVVAGPKDPIPPISGTVKEKSASPTSKSIETPRPPVEKKISLSKKPDELYRALLTTPIPDGMLPQNVTLKTKSAGKPDATAQAFNPVGQIDIHLLDKNINTIFDAPNAFIFYIIFPNSSDAKSVYEAKAASTNSERREIKDFAYPAVVITESAIGNPPVTGFTMAFENVLIATQIVHWGQVTQVTQERESIILAKAAIEYLKKAGQ